MPIDSTREPRPTRPASQAPARTPRQAAPPAPPATRPTRPADRATISGEARTPAQPTGQLCRIAQGLEDTFRLPGAPARRARPGVQPSGDRATDQMNDVLCATRNRQLNPSERRYITGSPQNAVRAALFHQDSSAATREAQRLWGTTRNMQTNGPGDAFRHAYWNALMTRRAGAQEAERFATAHEQTPGGNTDAARRMDLHNNAAGRRIAQANPNATPEQLSVLINNAYWRGELRTLPSSH